MKRLKLLSFVGMLSVVLLQDGRAATPVHTLASYEATDVCSVLKNPELYMHKKISIRGPVFVGVDGANIRDTRCPDEGIDLSVPDSRYDQADIVAFFQKVRSFGGHGMATVAGEFVTTNSPLTPYSLSIHKVSNLTRATP